MTQQNIQPTTPETLTESTSWATQQSIAIMAVDNLRPSEECLELMRRIDAQKITHETAVLTILQKADRYAANT
jgi:DNA-binding response OmpR family regulator